MAVNWALGLPQGNALDAFQTGMQQGQQMRQKQMERSALSAYAVNPDDPEAFKLMVKANPTMAIKIREDQTARKQAQQEREARMAVARGDPGAMEQLAGFDFDAWTKLTPQIREKAKQATAFMGQAVMDVSRLPEAQRAAAWTNYVQRAEASGMDIPTQYEQYSPEALNAAAAEAGTMEKLIKTFEPDWRFSPNGGLVDFNNPESISQYGQWMGSGKEPAVAPPPPGFVLDDGGPTQPASAGFP